MYSVDVNPEIIIKGYEMLKAKEGVCEYPPEVRISIYNETSHNVSLVCKHKDAGLNCGAGAQYCTRCLDKEKQYEANREFSGHLNVALGLLSQGW